MSAPDRRTDARRYAEGASALATGAIGPETTAGSEAARLADTASTRREALSHSQEHIDARREHADKIDPRKGAGRDDNGQKDGLNVDEPGRHTLRDGRADTMRPDVRTQ